MIKPVDLLAVTVRTIRWIRRAVLSCTGRRKEHSSCSYKVCDRRKEEADRSHAVTCGRASLASRAAAIWTSDPKPERRALLPLAAERVRSCAGSLAIEDDLVNAEKVSVQDFSHAAAYASRAKGGLATRAKIGRAHV